jgi:DNA-binding transcriptional LysR family regulator
MTEMHPNERLHRRIKLRDLDILSAVIELGGIGKAATRLNVSQPAVSKAIAELERMLGVQLFDRSKRGSEPTPHALALMYRATNVFDELRCGVQDMQFLSDPTSGEVRIGAPEPVSAAIVAPIVSRMSQQHPRMSFRVIAGDTETLLREMRGRNLDFVVSRISGALTDEVSSEVLFSDPLVVAADKNNPLQRRRQIALSDLAGERWTLQPENSFFGSLVMSAFRASGETLRLTVPTNSFDLRRELLASGQFLTVVPNFSLVLPRRHPSLKALPVQFKIKPHDVAILTVKGRFLGPLAQAFIQEIRRSVIGDMAKRIPASRERAGGIHVGK